MLNDGGSVGISQGGKSGGDTFGGAGAGSMGGGGGGFGAGSASGGNAFAMGVGVGVGGDAGAGALSAQDGGDVSDNTSIGTISISS
ncbi:MAG: hypothetical protein HQL51_11120 [Magnetococcales bacterium]|nr:hypothetical protein [Magnetococcales bacterium]